MTEEQAKEIYARIESERALDRRHYQDIINCGGDPFEYGMRTDEQVFVDVLRESPLTLDEKLLELLDAVEGKDEKGYISGDEIKEWLLAIRLMK